MLVSAINAYKSLIKEQHPLEKEYKVIEDKQVELLSMASVVLPYEEFYTTEISDEEGEIKELAKIQAKLDVYAWTHRKDIDKIRRRIEELAKKEVSAEDREKLLDELDEIKTKYKVFGRYIEDNDWKNLYRVKFNVLMSDINERIDSPLKHGQVESKEFEYYKRIIEDKISKILMAENPELGKTFGIENIPKAVKLIQNILKNGKKTFDFEQILKDKNMLRLILAFDRPDGIEKMRLNKDEIKVDFYGYFEWAKTIPVKSLYELTQEEYSFYVNSIDVKDNMYIQLYKMHDEYIRSLQQENETKDEGEPKTHKIPEGIVRISQMGKIGIVNVDGDRTREYTTKIHKFRQGNYNKIIFPSTLKYIGKGFIDNTWVDEIEFNEGLEEIGDDAFSDCPNLGRYKNMKMPQSLRKIGDRAFANCYNMAPLILNEGLEEIGDFAFWGSHTDYKEEAFASSNIVIIPSSVKKIGTHVVNPDYVKNLGFKNYKGQDIPKELLNTYYVGAHTFADSIIFVDATTKLDNIFLFAGDSLKPYMKIDPKHLIWAKDKSAKLREIVQQMQENEER